MFPSQCSRGFDKEGEWNRTKRPREKVEKLLRADQHSPFQQDKWWCLCASFWFSHPGSTSSWLHIWRSASLLEQRGLKVRVCVFWSHFLGFLYKHAVHLQATQSAFPGTRSEEWWVHMVPNCCSLSLSLGFSFLLCSGWSPFQVGSHPYPSTASAFIQGTNAFHTAKFGHR